ncbi:phospholipase D-like domain-containing protein [Haloferula sp.]|uniref:phospholipase D-like domain-containing protein n=1 Tax=Haloferula sp. TaxID=2497595 RepID=UPI0032A0FDDA
MTDGLFFRCYLPVLAITVMAGSVSSCRSIPVNFEPATPTYSTPPATKGDAADFSRDWQQRGGNKSGFLLVTENDESLQWRLALIDSAQSSIDLQTYLWSPDFSGQLLFDRMQRESDMAPTESDWVGLHAKAAVVDRKRVFIGSFNFSPRSRNLKTEMGILVDSPQLVKKDRSVHG